MLFLERSAEPQELPKSLCFVVNRVLPLSRRLTELRQDVIETRDTLKQVLDTDHQLAGLCLTDLQGAEVKLGELPATSESMREAALLLQSYERQISTVEGALKVRVAVPLP